MTLALICAALRRRPFSLPCTTLLVVISASLVGAPAPLALMLWLAASLVSLEVWHALESLVLRKRGFRVPTYAERERLDPALGCARVEILVVDSPQLWLGRGLRCLVVTRAMLDFLEERALAGLLQQVTAPPVCAALAGQLLVWLGALPVLGAWWCARALALLGRLLAIVVGAALVVPLALWPQGFLAWTGRLLGAMMVGLLGSALVSSGLAAAGLGLLVAWAVVPGVQALLGWESRRAETAADDATVAAGLGWHLVEALELLAEAEPLPRPAGLVGVLCPGGAPLTARAGRLRRALTPN
jgi:hypothetical protein